MKLTIISLTLALILTGACAGFASETKLPTPQKQGGPSLLNAIDSRSSANQTNFPSQKLNDHELSTVLWAASGKNRDGSKWTVPMAMGLPPYCDLYIADDQGIHLYNWENHSLQTKINGDHRTSLAMQEFAQKAPQIIILVSNHNKITRGDAKGKTEFGLIAVGSIGQHIYLAADAVGAKTRMVYSAHKDQIKTLLSLDDNNYPICIMPLGK